MSDTRTRETVFLGTKAIYQPIGSPTAPTNVAVKTTADAWTAFAVHANDTRNSSAGPLAQSRAIQAAVGPAAAATNKAAKTILEHHAAIARRMVDAPFPEWDADSTGYKSVVIGLEIARLFREASPTARATMLHAARSGDDPDTLRALVSAPVALTGLDAATHAGLTTAAKRLKDPAAFDGLAVEAKMVANATEALKATIDVAVANGAQRASILNESPDLVALFSAPPLTLAPERPEDAVALRAA